MEIVIVSVMVKATHSPSSMILHVLLGICRHPCSQCCPLSTLGARAEYTTGEGEGEVEAQEKAGRGLAGAADEEDMF